MRLGAHLELLFGNPHAFLVYYEDILPMLIDKDVSDTDKFENLTYFVGVRSLHLYHSLTISDLSILCRNKLMQPSITRL